MFSTPVSPKEEKPTPQTLLVHCNIFLGTSDKLAKDKSVLVEGNLIKTAGDAKLKGAQHAEIVDCADRKAKAGLPRPVLNM